MFKNYIKLLLSKIIVCCIDNYIVKENVVMSGVNKEKRILILAPHPDDEVIGLGGVILKMLKKGVDVHVVYLTDGEGSMAWGDKERIKKERIRLADKVMLDLKIPEANIYRLHLQDGNVPHLGVEGFEVVVKTITDIVSILKPECIFATHPLDFWPYDHVACSEIAVEVKKRAVIKVDLWFYWVWTWYHLKPWNLKTVLKRKLVKVDVSNEYSQKIKFINDYLVPKSPEGKPWSGELPKSMIYPFTKPFEIIEKYE